jgi:DNA-binding MurR/RpiR family transcriptional regulator
MVNMDDLTPKQQCIIQTAKLNPNLSKEGIADQCGCSVSTVRRTFNKYGDQTGGSNIFGPGF